MKTYRFLASLLAVALLAGCAGIDKNERCMLVQHKVSPAVYDRMVHGDILTLSDIIELSRRGVPSSLIIRYLDSTRAIYALDKPALARLNQEKVCKEVIDYLLQTPVMFGARYYSRPGYYGGPVYPYDAYYPCYPYPYYPTVYGSSVIVVGSRWHRW